MISQFLSQEKRKSKKMFYNKIERHLVEKKNKQSQAKEKEM